MITIVDYGMGNLGSILNMFKRIGAKATVSSDPEHILKAEKVLLPGVGAFGNAMARIDAIGVREALNDVALQKKIPTLGICLGMQLLTDSSEEGGGVSGFGWIPARTVRFELPASFKVPHMGWNRVLLTQPSALTDGLADESRFYFVHSYYVKVGEERHSILKADYGVQFDAAIQRDNIFGAQFHPEKSHRFGMKLLENFASI